MNKDAYAKAVLINKYYSMIIYVVHLQDAITCPIGLIGIIILLGSGL